MMRTSTHLDLLCPATPGMIAEANKGNGCVICMKPLVSNHPHYKEEDFLQCLEYAVADRRRVWTNNPKPTSGTEMYCAIPVTLSCGHVFGYECITSWFQKTENRANNTCPICRTKPTSTYRALSPKAQSLQNTLDAYTTAFKTQTNSILRQGCKCLFTLSITPQRLAAWGREVQGLMLALAAEHPCSLEIPKPLVRSMELFCSSWATGICCWIAGKEKVGDEPLDAALFQMVSSSQTCFTEAVGRGEILECAWRFVIGIMLHYRHFFDQVLGCGIMDQQRRLGV
ncbi:uncharacterized protein K452DRAFT_306542 [Aplosporella prunicola CBS 121167]|uniref:RING-type domain-containing protein n=1 Tax=Aplosporella prunicola CBS 121167 TaxID=1176127 RepID=A0A6A6BKW6_9PEZI|nr:uncharacterized protein K452DRAFT_306542 [Aplosporella prunicola CBS 121167]KAF2144772.1 hypothetical protein K452DRAFT_306542 [Aplosporella prunicola CBS 121167]